MMREIKRNTDKRGYRYNQADGFAQQRHQAKSKFINKQNALLLVKLSCALMMRIYKNLNCCLNLLGFYTPKVSI
jgi:hypothetical protein